MNVEYDISFVIPVLNGSKTIQNCLNSILSQTSEMNYEVIVVDNGSTDETLDIVKNVDVNLIVEQKRGRSFARNCGVNKAKGKWIAFIDCDVELDNQWLSNLAPIIKDDLYNVIQGKIIPKSLQINSFSQFREKLLAFQTHGSFCSLNDIRFVAPQCNTAACVVKRSAIIEVGQFDTSLDTHEDYDLGWRLWRNGHKFYVANKVVSYVYWDRGQYFSYISRYFYMGKGYHRLVKKWQLTPPKTLFKWRMYLYKNIKFALVDLLLQLAFFFGFKSSGHNPKHHQPTLKKASYLAPFSYLIGTNHYEFHPCVRVIKTEKKFIFKNIKSHKQLEFDVQTANSPHEEFSNIIMSQLAALKSNNFIINTYKQ